MRDARSEEKCKDLIGKMEITIREATNKSWWPWTIAKGIVNLEEVDAFILELLRKKHKLLDEIGQMKKELEIQDLRITKALKNMRAAKNVKGVLE